MTHTRHDTRGVDYTCYGCKDPTKASDAMTYLPDATARNFPQEDHYDEYNDWQEEVEHWQRTHTHRTGRPDNEPIVAGQRYWDNNLRVVEVTEVAPRSYDSRPYPGGEIQTWHQTTAGKSDTMTGGLEGRLSRYYPSTERSPKHDAMNYPVGTNYSDVK